MHRTSISHANDKIVKLQEQQDVYVTEQQKFNDALLTMLSNIQRDIAPILIRKIEPPTSGGQREGLAPGLEERSSNGIPSLLQLAMEHHWNVGAESAKHLGKYISSM